MKFEIENINVISSDFGESLEDFWITLDVDIFEKGKSGAETFSINIVSLKRLARLLENGSFLGRGMIFCEHYEESNIVNILKNLLNKIDATKWPDFINEFERYFDQS